MLARRRFSGRDRSPGSNLESESHLSSMAWVCLRDRETKRGARDQTYLCLALWSYRKKKTDGGTYVGWRREREGERHLIIVVAASLHMTFDTSVTPSDDDDSDAAADAAVANDCKLLHRRETCIPSRRPRDPTGWSKRVAPGNKCL